MGMEVGEKSPETSLVSYECARSECCLQEGLTVEARRLEA
jgi:hypothetical protein